MASGIAEVLPERIRSALVIAPHGTKGVDSGTQLVTASHPAIDATSLHAGRVLREAVNSATHEIIFAVSGGGSALVCVPAAGVSLAMIRDSIARAVSTGATIHELNVLRRHLSAIKGGKLAQSSPVAIHTFVSSDVAGDVMSDVASGPTVADPTTFEDALLCARKFSLDHDVIAFLERGARDGREQTTTSRSWPLPILVAGYNAAAAAAAKTARERCERWPSLDGDVASVAQRISQQISSQTTRLAIANGESTLALGEEPGRGGRAQHLAFELARLIAGRGGVRILVAGTDGRDGNTEAAGAVVDGDTWSAIADAGIDPSVALQRRDSNPALAAAGATFATGATGINHADLLLAQFDNT